MARLKPLSANETMRLAVLGRLAEGTLPYADLAISVRRFVERLVGPSLDLLGSSLEVLRLEGLIQGEGGNTGDTAVMYLTESGRSAFMDLMEAPLKAPLNDTQKLSLALKLRFLKLLDEEGRLDQLDAILEVAENEEARLSDLIDPSGPSLFQDWLQSEIDTAAKLRHLAKSEISKIGS